MTKFSQFGEAARLYAKNADIVDAMAKHMRDDITSFIDDLKNILQIRLSPIRLVPGKETEQGIEYFILVPNSWERPSLSFARWSSKLVDPGEMELFLSRPYKLPENFDEGLVASIRSSSDLPTVAWLDDTQGAILRGRISYGHSNPIEACAPVFELLLRKLEERYIAREK